MGLPDPRRRQLVAALIGAGFVRAADARDRVRVVGWLHSEPPSEGTRRALKSVGYVEGENLRLEARLGRGPDSPALAPSVRELVAARPEAILAFWPFHVSALLAQTRTIPIVCGPIPDPVAAGFARSLRRPGGNVTGLSTGSHEIWELVIATLRRLRPGLRRIVVVHSPGMPVEVQMRAHAEAARAAGLEWRQAAVSSVAEAAATVASVAGEAIHLAPIGSDDVLRQVVRAAREHRVMVFGGEDGCLIGYWRRFSDPSLRMAVLLDKILRGASPGELPFELPDQTHLRIDRNVARAIGVEIPADLLLRATEVVG